MVVTLWNGPDTEETVKMKMSKQKKTPYGFTIWRNIHRPVLCWLALVVISFNGGWIRKASQNLDVLAIGQMRILNIGTFAEHIRWPLDDYYW